MVDGEVGGSEEARADGVVELDGEEEVGSQVGAVDVEGLVPARVGVVVVQQSGAAHSCFLQVDGGVQPRRCVQPCCFFDAVYHLHIN